MMDGDNLYGEEGMINDLLNTSMISDLPTEGSDAEDPVTEGVLDGDDSSIIYYDSADDTDVDPNWQPSDTEEPDDQEVQDQPTLPRVRSNIIVGRDKKTLWHKDPPPTSRTRAHNIVTKLPGLCGPALQNKPTTPYEAWRLLINDNMINKIVDFTNEKITEKASNYGETNLNCQYTHHIGYDEMTAFLGLIYLSGVYKSNHEDVRSLFANDGTGRDIFRATMSKNRFLFLLECIRFDDKSTREQRKETDPIAAISELFNQFVKHSQENYTCSQNMTVDEMLVSFRGRFRYRVYMKNKPAKYGIKIMILADSRTHYFYNGFVYCGPLNTPNPNKLLVPTMTVLSLTKPIFNSNRNITGDNWFSSVELVDQLKLHGLTYVGTVRKNKREIPTSFMPHKEREPLSSEFAFTSSKTIVSYVPKKSQAVILISSMHHDRSIMENEEKKPEIIDFYNCTKVGVDSLDQKCANYSVGRRTRRWPLVVWYAMMDISAVNALMILRASQPIKNVNRQNFLISLGKTLIMGHMRNRVAVPNLPRELRVTIRKCMGTEELEREEPGPQQPKKRRRCHICPRDKDRKYLTQCSKCFSGVCKDHSSQAIVCDACKD